ncbi:MAG: RagB/SusD family nutrient uptake outer membrane protein [Gemmatimonadota bacterium]|nr:RagB/SusD family nutrient uptake outer membrane protein [Gemmatimonadota bacterium]
MKTVSRHPLLLGTAFLLLGGATLYGCKDFLTEAAAPQGTLDEQTVLTKAGVEGTLIAAYRALDHNGAVGGAWGSAASNWVWGSVTSDDAYKGSEASDQPDINDIEGYHWATANAERYLNDKWRAVYEGVVRANATIRLLKKVVAEKPGEIPAADARGIEGEALFLRAHYHFEAWRMWERIPYYRDDDDDFRKANNTSTEVLTAILADLDAAIGLLPTAPRLSQKGRASQWTAKAYKGRVQVYAKQYAAALTTLREVRASGVYALQPSFEQVWSGFQTFTNGPETIFAYQASSNDGEPSGNNANFGERLNFPHSGSHFGCCGFHQPSQNLVNFYSVDAATGLPIALSNPTGWNTRNDNLDAAASQTMTVDPRLDWTVGRDGVPYKDWGMHAPGWIRSPTYGGPYSPKRHIHENASGAEQKAGGWAPTQQNSVNIHLFRYADMLLLLAEAEVEAPGGSLENARAIVNEIRARAGQRAQGCGLPTITAAATALVTRYPQCAGDSRMAVPIDDPSITWADYRIGLYMTPWTDQAFARTAVQYERRLELAMEGQRFFDLRRYGTAEQVLNAYVNGGAGSGGGAEENRRSHLQSAEAYTAKHNLYPIPAIQIQLSRVGGQDRLTQNPQW